DEGAADFTGHEGCQTALGLDTGGSQNAEQSLLFGNADDGARGDATTEPGVPAERYDPNGSVDRNAPQRSKAISAILAPANTPQMESTQDRCRERKDKDCGIHRTEIRLADPDPEIARDGLAQNSSFRHGYRTLLLIITAMVMTPATRLRNA